MQNSGISPPEQDRWNEIVISVISVINVISEQQNRPADRYLLFPGMPHASLVIWHASSQ